MVRNWLAWTDERRPSDERENWRRSAKCVCVCVIIRINLVCFASVLICDTLDGTNRVYLSVIIMFIVRPAYLEHTAHGANNGNSLVPRMAPTE